MGIKKRRLGDLLLDENKITKNQLQVALNNQKTEKKKLGEILVEIGAISEDEIFNILEKQLGIERVYLDSINLEEKIVSIIPENIAKKYNVIAIDADETEIIAATSDPLNIFAIEDIKIITGKEVRLLSSPKSEVERAINKVYSNIVEYSSNSKEEVDLFNSEIMDSPIVKTVNWIIENAINAKASDIHIEPLEGRVKVRFRLDGQLKEIMSLEKKDLNAIVARIKILSSLDIAKKRVPQDGRILTKVNGIDIDLRVSTLPTVNGEKIVIRVLDKSANNISRNNLGLDESDEKKLRRIISKPHGIILSTGPTGSGKSTTLYSILKELNDESRNIITIEDPVEFSIEGINQVNVNYKTGLTFSYGLRSILRQDPDVIMVGEIRDAETSKIAMRAAITGHLVLSTLHTNDAPSTIIRLIDMGIEPYLIATSIVGVISQRLIRIVCPNCSENYEASSYEKKLLNIDVNEKVIIKRKIGCNKCNKTGYKGRVGVFEIMEIDQEIREYITNGESIDNITKLAIEKGMTTIRDACISKVLDKTTTIEELIRIAYLENN
ncbi:GspE/PulE family protein [Clostridium senegalense]|uniref:Type II/IV secretion system protein n=1 Tax=Clostridium senegalense TaxID=1465809 RepID=A0A6M0H761_9CLOT|nr:GspE/PulE family protein [Clostridium senegalense]NEU05843.1 type II/IV secretion system protein [Clostridium senegalense]